jgi:hypothetical protein
VLVLGELIGLFLLVGKPILTLNKTIAEFNAELRNMKDRVKTLENNEHDEHNELWEHNTAQDEKISDHETRIRILEKEA